MTRDESNRKIAEAARLDPFIIADIVNPLTVKRFLSFVQQAESGCLLWTGHRNAKGYGIFYLSKQFDCRPVLAHRVAWVIAGNVLLPELVLDHTCRVHACVHISPEHIEQVSNAVNVLRGEGITANNKRKTSCPKGHAYEPSNTYIHKGKRSCLTCLHARPSEKINKSIAEARRKRMEENPFPCLGEFRRHFYRIHDKCIRCGEERVELWKAHQETTKTSA